MKSNIDLSNNERLDNLEQSAKELRAIIEEALNEQNNNQ